MDFDKDVEESVMKLAEYMANESLDWSLSELFSAMVMADFSLITASRVHDHIECSE